MVKPYYWPAKTVPGGPCVMCGTPSPAMRFCCDLRCGDIPHGYVAQPHLHRTCSACGGQWLERPVNSADDPPPPLVDPPTLDEYLRAQTEKE